MLDRNRDIEIADRYPHLYPILNDLERAFAAIEAFNGGHGMVVIHMKDGSIPDFDVSMRHFQRQRLNNKIA